MRSLVSGERMMGVAGHGVLGEEGAEKVGGHCGDGPGRRPQRLRAYTEGSGKSAGFWKWQRQDPAGL